MAIFSVKRGTTVRMTATVRDITGALANAADVNLNIRYPDGSTTSTGVAFLTHPSVGVYYLEQNLDQAGDYWIQFATTSPTVVEEAIANVLLPRA